MTRRTEVVVSTADGSCPCVLATPDDSGPWPAVILFMDAGGVRPALIEMAEQLSAMGYVTLLPEMYYRHGPYEPFRLETAFSDPQERSRLMSMAGTVSNTGVAADTSAFVEFLSTLPQVAGRKVGTTGYCLGGRMSVVAAASRPDRIAAAASFHGGRLATDDPDSPHLLVDRIAGRLYVAAAENDGSFTPEQADLLERALTDAGVDHEIEVYPALHGFAVPDNPTFDAASAARHWAALDGLFQSALTN
jgi:carboxymethylenebutenolidase